MVNSARKYWLIHALIAAAVAAAAAYTAAAHGLMRLLQQLTLQQGIAGQYSPGSGPHCHPSTLQTCSKWKHLLNTLAAGQPPDGHFDPQPVLQQGHFPA
jgi:hypothetical protein